MRTEIRVLHLEDSPRDAELLHERLKAGGMLADIVLVDGKDRFEAALVEDVFDVVLCDFNLPDFDGMSAIELVKEKQPETPVIVVSGTLGEEAAVKCLQIGALDYLFKDRLERLVPAVQRALREVEERRQRHLAEEVSRKQQAQLSSIYNAVADVIFYVTVEQDGGYRFTSVNPAFASTTGLDVSHVVGKRVEEVIPAPSLALVLEKYGQAIREKKIVRWEETSDYPKGRLTGEVSIVPVFDDAGNCTHLVGAVHDLTQRKKLEAQFYQAQKMEGVGQLAGGIAHDFNNLLTVINGSAELALAQVPDGGQLHQDLQEIRRAGERAAGLTRQLLAFSRRQILEPTVLDLNTLIQDMESMLSRLLDEDIDLVFRTSEGQGLVLADPGQLEQVIINLAVNARDAMPQGGRLTIETQNVEIDEQYAHLRGAAVPPGRYVMLAVSDTGIGMHEDTRKRIFEPFFTTKAPGKGTGLGLSTVDGIIKQSGGFVCVSSEVGRGTSFRIYLPQSAGTATGRWPRRTVVPTRGTETVLVVEDVAGLLHFTKRALESGGYTVLTAADGEEALRVLEQHDRPVHLVITDVVLPGMSGRTLAEQFESAHPGMKVLYMSGYTDNVVVRHGVLEERMPFLSKPFTIPDLLRKVREVLDSNVPPLT